MDDLRLMNGYEFLLAGDYFIDVLRSSHILLFNKGMYQDHYQTDPNEVYEWVLNRETASLLIPKYYGEALQVQYVTDPYASKNGADYP